MNTKGTEWTISSVKCPYCKCPVLSRRAERFEPIYEDSKGVVWGETSVVTFDYKGYHYGVVNQGIRKECFVGGEQILSVCECIIHKALEEKCREINISPGLAKKGFNNFLVCNDNREAYQACVEFSLSFSDNTIKGIGIHGGTGVGKTHLASAIVSQILTDQIKRGEPCSAAFLTVPKLLQELRWWRTDDALKKEQDTFKLLSDRRIIVLDDLGVYRLNEHQVEQLFLIIDGRMINEKPLIVTTNVDPSLLDSYLGERVADRLREACAWHQIRGQSWRGRDT